MSRTIAITLTVLGAALAETCRQRLPRSLATTWQVPG
jgi:hypothetical protein